MENEELNAQVNQIKSKFAELDLECSEEDALHIIRKNKLKTLLESLVDEGHTRSEIDKTVKSILAERAN